MSGKKAASRAYTPGQTDASKSAAARKGVSTGPIVSVLMSARLARGLLAATLALSALSVTASAAATSRLGGSTAGTTTLLILDRPVAALAAPAAGARVVGEVPVWTRFTRSRMTLPVVQTAVGSRGGLWERVRLPMRPNGATGWVPAAAGSAASTGWEIVVRRAERRALVLDEGRVRASFPVVVGKPSTPTPLGTFFVVEKLRLAPGVTEGPWALATSAYSDALSGFAGGDGQVALHGTVGLSDPLGTFSSHGCVRFAPAAISWIADHVDVGAPVIVTP
jgi:lipoprotein-anchoring transpeptidase ErfK/SrfK